MTNRFSWQPSPVSGDFVSNLYKFLYPLEVGKDGPLVLTDVKGNPTIGLGYDLVTGDKEEINKILKIMGFSDAAVTSTIRPMDPGAAIDYDYLVRIRKEFHTGGSPVRINSIMAERFNEKNPDFRRMVGSNLRPSFTFVNADEVKSVFPFVWPAYLEKMETQVPQLKAELDSQTSREIIAMSSLAWNGGAGILGKGLQTALSLGNRAEAWYEIRYDSNKKNDKGLQKRRFFEA
jgi:hypothetical protein